MDFVNGWQAITIVKAILAIMAAVATVAGFVNIILKPVAHYKIRRAYTAKLSAIQDFLRETLYTDDRDQAGDRRVRESKKIAKCEADFINAQIERDLDIVVKASGVKNRNIDGLEIVFENARLLAELRILDVRAEEDDVLDKRGAGQTRTPREEEILVREHLGRKFYLASPLHIDLDKRRKQINRYFEAVKRSKRKMGLALTPQKDMTTLLTVHFEDGYVAPIFLLDGLIGRLGENWGRLVDFYHNKHAATDNIENAQVTKLRHLVAFQFNCWLLWGPSIPICTCGKWKHGKENFVCQYGYGDENNAIAIVGGKGIDAIPGVSLKQKAEEGICATKYVTSGQIRSGKYYDNDDVALGNAQKKGIAGSHGTDPRIVLVNIPGGNYAYGGEVSPYYSAYIWIMFVALDQKGLPILSSNNREKWRNLMPFFEHANIADEAVLRRQKALLASKAAVMVRSLLKDNAELCLALACSFDQSLCDGSHDIACPFPHDGRLLTLFAEICDRDAELKGFIRDGRLRLPKARDVRGDAQGRCMPVQGMDGYSACDLPERIEEFYESISKSEDARQENRLEKAA